MAQKTSVYIAEQEEDKDKNQGRQEKQGSLLRVLNTAGLLLFSFSSGVYNVSLEHQIGSPVGAKPNPTPHTPENTAVILMPREKCWGPPCTSCAGKGAPRAAVQVHREYTVELQMEGEAVTNSGEHFHCVELPRN